MKHPMLPLVNYSCFDLNSPSLTKDTLIKLLLYRYMQKQLPHCLPFPQVIGKIVIQTVVHCTTTRSTDVENFISMLELTLIN